MSSSILEEVCLKVASMNVTKLERPRFDRNDECACNMAELPLKDMDGGTKVKSAVDIVEQELLWGNIFDVKIWKPFLRSWVCVRVICEPR